MVRFHLCEVSKIGRFIETEVRLEITRVREREELSLMGTEFLLGMMKKF